MRRSERSPRTDRDLGIRTARPTSLDSLAIRGDSAAHANRYEPTPYGVLEDMLAGLGIEYPRHTFIDLGSGKGRILCVAAAYPFARIIGVEHARELHEAAVENIAALPAGRRRCRDVRSLHLDASSFQFPPDPAVIFMFNPFAASVMALVLEKLERSLVETPRPIHLLYYMPVLGALLERSNHLRRVFSERDRVIYASHA